MTQSKSFSKLLTFLQSKRNNGADFTHGSFGKLNITMNIDNETQFKKLYLECIDNNDEICIYERPTETTCFYIDCDFKCTTDKCEGKLYDEEHILAIVKTTYEQIKKIYNINNDVLCAYVFEKDEPTINNDIVKDGFHIMFPHIILSQKERQLLRLLIIDNVDKTLFDDFLEDINGIIDKATVGYNGWMLPFSRKPNHGGYKLSFMYDCDCLYDEIEMSNEEQYNLFSLRNKKQTLKIKISDEQMDQLYDKYELNIKTTEVDYVAKPEDIDEAKTLALMLSDDRASEYGSWRDVGFALHSVSSSLFDTFDEFSQRSNKYNKKEVYNFWTSIKTGLNQIITIRSLHYWAKEDNAEAYKNYISSKFNKVDDHVEMFINLENDVIAKFIFNSNAEKYKYIKLEKGGLWVFYDDYNKIILSDTPADLYNFSSTVIKTEIKNIIDNIEKKIKASSNEDEIKNLKNQISKLKTSSKKAGMSGYIKGLKDYLCENYADNKIYNIIDENKYLFSFNNKVYDVKQGILRDIKTDDNIMLNTGYDFPNVNLSDVDEKKTYIYKFINSLFKTEEETNYSLDVLALSMIGNMKEAFYVHTGHGRNGKSALFNFAIKAFGDYGFTGEATSLIKKQFQDEKDPTLAQAKGKRLFVISEPADGIINIEKVKRITGNDEIKCRDLFKSMTKYMPQFTTHMICNEKPELDKVDTAVEQRVKVINYPFTFKQNPQNENEKIIDETLKDKLNRQENIIDFMIILMKRLQKLVKIDKYGDIYVESLIIPQRFRDETHEYIDDSNPVKKFIDERYEITNNKNDRIERTEFVKEYNDYSEKKLTAQRITSFLTTTSIQIKKAQIGQKNTQCLIGIKRKDIDDDEE